MTTMASVASSLVVEPFVFIVLCPYNLFLCVHLGVLTYVCMYVCVCLHVCLGGMLRVRRRRRTMMMM